MSIQTELNRIKNAKAAIKAAIEGKGVTVPNATLLDGMAALIESIEAGGGGREFKCTYGTITPIEKIFEIEHGLGEKPAYFMYYTEVKNITGRTMDKNASLASGEQALKSVDWYHYEYTTRPVVILVGDEVYSYSISSYTDWGFFTKFNLANVYKNVSCYCNEKKFHASKNDMFNNIIPCSASGNVTIHWFALGGVI